ncbi:cell wall hydrolase [Pacificimonas sp. WHA3]|uniref:Cell wall hydrolase n=1 Tax=Pacificimonas pallii TaxID=2827236 RepID=A0ABS6SCV2_9SPHN|nr:cell wall hydrolase [Pacificimonas pallii]MBV7255746.1 cell wall hydrolase [Pacificimonas pallii]
MLKSKRAIALALGSLGLLAAADVSTDLQAAPVVLQDAPPVTFTLEAEDFDFIQPLAAVSTQAEIEAPAHDISLNTLVRNVRDYGTPELDEEMRCLASAVYNEARGEPLEGQLAVAQVVLNRVDDRRWPSSICAVVYQRSQFSFTFDGKPDVPAVPNNNWKRAEAVAVVAATENWEDVTDEAVFFHATYVQPKWRRAFEKTADIGQHIFYR